MTAEQKAASSAAILLRQVSKYVYDVFADNGYDSWSRVRRNTWGVVVVGGCFLNKEACSQLEKAIAKHPMGCMEAINV